MFRSIPFKTGYSHDVKSALKKQLKKDYGKAEVKTHVRGARFRVPTWLVPLLVFERCSAAARWQGAQRRGGTGLQRDDLLTSSCVCDVGVNIYCAG